MKPLETGVIGCGRIRDIYFKTLAKDETVEVVTCASFVLRIEVHLSDIKTRAIPMNINDAITTSYAGLGF